MKRSYGVMAILLPLPHPKKPLVLPYPVQAGDRLQTGMLQQLQGAAPATLPLSHLGGRKLILNLFQQRTGTHIAVFPSLEQARFQPGGRVHPLLLTAHGADRLDVFLGNGRSVLDVALPQLPGAQPFQTLLAFEDKPHLLHIHPSGEVRAITEGYYISQENIRKASGYRPRKARLV